MHVYVVRTLMLFLHRVKRKTVISFPPIVTNTLVALNHNTRNPHLLKTRRNL